MSTDVHAGAHAVHSDPEGAKTGMWLFLFTELLLFGGLFLIYSVYRFRFTAEFHHAAGELDVTMGVINTIVLLTSSLTAVLAVGALQRGQEGWARLALGSTMMLAVLFLLIKTVEWSAKASHGIFPGMHHLAELPDGEGLFFNLYFMMTGLHGLHVVGGIVAMLVVWRRLGSGSVTKANQGVLEYTALYWHLVDLVWIFLLPLFYLTN